MENFSNETIDLQNLPRFEEVKLKPLQKKYFQVMLVNFFVLFGLIFIGYILVFILNPFEWPTTFINGILPVIVLVCIASFFYIKLSFSKKGFAFRTHDAIFKSGLISESTTVVPFNRVQHVALHQGFIARNLGLASIELFTAGGSSSDLEIPGLLLEEAQQIKNMVSQKINPTKQAPVQEHVEESFPETIIPESDE
ncbi:PH domain-containing protein [Flavobacterium ardleyense]|uniref:PH domain-containing protein n=1 Tax=Flavobacterium ardleyense TaxID=2038737 RepID=A0ABW5ZBN8_9FLAO